MTLVWIQVNGKSEVMETPGPSGLSAVMIGAAQGLHGPRKTTRSAPCLKG